MPSYTADFLAATREMRITSGDMLINEATKNDYFFYHRMMKAAKDNRKGGEKLVDFILGADSGNFEFYDPNDEFSPTTRDVTDQVTVPWAFAKTDWAVTDEEAKLNEGDSTRFFKFVTAKTAAALTAKVNGMEEALWATPNVATMENSSSTQNAFSIPAFVTRDGLAPSSTNGGVANSTDWTTVETLNPTNKTYWRNATATYTAADKPDLFEGIVAGFDALYDDTKFMAPDPLLPYQQDERRQQQVIATSSEGNQLFKQCLRSLSDSMADFRDPAVNGPQYAGVPVVRVAQLDNAGWTAGSPDYFFLNLAYLKPCFHESSIMREEVNRGGANHPNKTVVHYFTYYNLFCLSRRRQGRLSAA